MELEIELPSFKQLLTRADVPTLEVLIGTPAVGLLRLVDESLIHGDKLREVLCQIRSEADIFCDPNAWIEIASLLRKEEALDLLAKCGVADSEDPWAALGKIGVKNNAHLAGVIYSYFGVAPPQVDPVENRAAVATVRTLYGLFPHQDHAAKKVASKLTERERRVVLHMPTGSGKTRTAMHIICQHLRNNPNTAVIWLAYSEELCEQAATEFELAWQHLGTRSITIARYWGHYDPDVVEVRDGLIVASLAKTYRRVLKDLQFGAMLGESVSLIVIDEAHQAIAPTYGLLLDCLQSAGRRSSILGLTATPGRSWDDLDEDRKLASFFDNQKVTLTVHGYTNPVEYLIDKGYLARPTYRNLLYESGRRITPADLVRIQNDLDIPVALLKSIGEDEQRNLRIVCEVEALAARHKRILVFAPSVANSALVANTLQAHGKVSARSVVGNTALYDRQLFIRWFKCNEDEPRVLCNYGVLTTGFDAPQTSAVVIARPTKSLVLYSQMVGRGTRGTKAGGNETAEIVTVVDTSLPGFRNLAESFNNWEDAGWDSI